jgi:hypothetical protein
MVLTAKNVLSMLFPLQARAPMNVTYMAPPDHQETAQQGQFAEITTDPSPKACAMV